jgi:putative transposase
MKVNRVERHIIYPKNPYYKMLDEYCFKSKNINFPPKYIQKILDSAKFMSDIKLSEIPKLLHEAKTLLFVFHTDLYENNFGIFETKAIIKEYKGSYLGRSFYYIDLLSYPEFIDKEKMPYMLAAYDYDTNFKIEIGEIHKVVTRDILEESNLDKLLKKFKRDQPHPFEITFNEVYDRYVRLKIVKD